jgi:hypothetical protein
MDYRNVCRGILIGLTGFLIANVALPVVLNAAAKVNCAKPNDVSIQQTKQSQQSAVGGQQAANAASPPGSAMHSITVTFDYDFTKTPACSDKVKTKCVAKFSVYDISEGKPIFLFSVLVPAEAKGLVKGIAASSPRMAFVVGSHRIGVAAQTPDGKESPPRECKAIIEIKASASDSSTSH